MPEQKTCDPPHVIHNLVVSCIALCKLNRINHDRMCNFLTVIKFVSMLFQIMCHVDWSMEIYIASY